MRHEHGKRRVPQDVARCAPENELDQASTSVGPHDQEIGVLLVCKRLYCLAGTVDKRDDCNSRLYTVMPQVQRYPSQFLLCTLPIVNGGGDVEQLNLSGSNEKRHCFGDSAGGFA